MTELDRLQQAAAFHGLATNRALPPSERLELALQALDLYESEIEAARESGYESAVASLRDEARYRRWMTTDTAHHWWPYPEAGPRFADYLEATKETDR